MGDELKAERKAPARAAAEPSGARSVSEIALNGSIHRVDLSHRPPGVEPEQTASDRATIDPQPATTSPVERSSSRTASRESDLLLQASQIAEHLRCQFSELDRREQTLNEQLALLDRERRSARLWLQQLEEELQERQVRLTLQESELTQRMESIERIAAELQQSEHDLAERREQVDSDRATMKESLSRELAAERNSLHRAQQMLQTEHELLAAQRAQQQLEHVAALAELQGRLEIEREILRKDVRTELETEFAELEVHRAEWLNQREAELLEIARERELSDKACRQSEGELAELREKEIRSFEAWKATQLAEFEQKRQRHERGIREEREAFERELTSKQKEWVTRRDAERMQLECDRESSAAAIERAKSDLETLQHEQLEELRRLRDEHNRTLAQERSQFETERDRQLAEMVRERTLLDNRVRFQQEHLEKLRAEIEESQREFRAEQQQSRLRAEEAANQQRLRASQYDRHRAALEEREASLAREQQVLAEIRKNLDVELQEERRRLEEERASWEQEQDAQRAEIRRQQDLLTLNSESLEGRRSRLDQLRNELETTHRETLEMRMAVEEAWAQFTQGAGLETANERFDTARAALVEHFGQTRETLSRHRDDVSQAQAQLERERDEFRKERTYLTNWIAERGEQLKLWEQRLAKQSASLESNESERRDDRDEWNREKLNAERIIRDLLAQLAELTAPMGRSSTAIVQEIDDVDEPSNAA